MRCKSVNSLNDFEFHDAIWSLVSWDSDSLVVEARYLNIHGDAPQNDLDCDMEIVLARIVFKGFLLKDYGPGVLWKADESGKSYPAEEMVVYEGKRAVDFWQKELEHGVTVFSFQQADDGGWELRGCGEEPYFEARFSFADVIVEWDEFRRPAWYVLRERGIEE